MRRRREIPTRNEVMETNEESREMMEEKESDLDTIASDVEAVRETREKLDFGGTQEGAEELDLSIDEAEDVTTEVFETEDENLEEIQSENEEFEGEIQEGRDSSDSDLGKVVEVSVRVETKETINELLTAKEALMRDIDFLAEQIHRASDNRERSNETQETYRDRVRSGKGGR